MKKIIRTATKATGGITDQEREQMREIANLWIRRAFRTEPIEAEKITAAIKGLYRVSGLKEPRVVIVPSPRVMALAGGFASAIWWLRKNPGNPLAAATQAATQAATYAATRAATDAAQAATDAATQAATQAATYAATRAATDAAQAATDAATRAATDAATSAATDAATWAATSAAIQAATDAATWAATDAATWAATRAATSAATSAATGDATWAATWDATDAATWDATDAATRAATDAATWDATRAATDAAQAATYAATWDATDAATRAATRAATDAATGAATGAATDFFLRCAQEWYRCYQGGNMWVAWQSYLSACRDVLGLKLPVFDKYQYWEDAAIHGGFRFMHEKFCMVSDFPEFIKVDAEHRPHCDDGPTHRWRDGWELFHWHGIPTTEQVIMRPETITVEQVQKEENAELRRVMVERMGWDKFVAESKTRVIHVDQLQSRFPKLPVSPLVDNSDPEAMGYVDGAEKAELLVSELLRDFEDRAIKFVRLTCPSTGRIYTQRVAHNETRAYAAIAKSFGLTEEQYKSGKYFRQGDVLMWMLDQDDERVLQQHS